MDPWRPGWYPAHGVCAKGVCRGGTTTSQACGLRRESSIHGDSVSSTAEGKTQLLPSAAETIREWVLKHLARQLPGRACHFPEQTRPSEAKDAALIVQARGSGFILSLFSRSSRQPFLLREPSPLLLQARATVLAPFLAPEKDQQASGSCRAPLCHGLLGTGVQKANKNLGKI